MDTQVSTQSIPIAVTPARKLPKQDSKENLNPELNHVLSQKTLNRKGTLSRQSGKANILEPWPNPKPHVDASLPALPPPPTSGAKKTRPKSAAYDNYSVPGFKDLAIRNPARWAKSTSSVKKKVAATGGARSRPHFADGTRPYSIVYPSFRTSDRRAPLIDDSGLPRRIVTHHRGTIRALAAVNGSRVATGSYTIKIWDTASCQAMQTITPAMLHGTGHSTSPQDNDMDGTERVSSLAFAPSRSMQNVGRYLWAGLSDGHVVILDTWQSKPFSFRRHERSVKIILQVQNTEMWTLDSEGVLNRWPLPHAGEDVLPDLMCTDGYHHRVTPCAVAAVVVVLSNAKDHVLWITSGRTLDVYHFPPCHSNHPQISITRPHHVLCVPNELGSVTQMQVLPGYRIACAHDDGHVSVWDTQTMRLLHVAAVSMYGITAMVLTQGRYLWTAHRTGRMQILDIGQQADDVHKWTAIKQWEAHQAPILKLVLDETGLLSSVKDNHIAQIVSVDAHGIVVIWDGLLKQHWIDQQLQKQEPKYCTYRETRIMMCTWNIDACKPDSFDRYDEDKIHEWLGIMDDPDFIVVGLQEMVDLESKRQTARSILFKRKKTDSIYNEHKHTRQHERWREFLTRVICDNYGDVYRLEKTEYLVGLYSLVFAKGEDRHRISDIQSMIIKTGLKVMNKSWHGNKGATAIRMVVDDDSLCFVNCHLAAGQSRATHRNADAETIFKAAKFTNNQGILDHDHCFLSGDLNYRIDHFSRAQIEDQLLLVQETSSVLESLLAHDQLIQQRKTNPLLKLLLFDEAPITFKPTYKYDPGTDIYDTSEKQRLPAWCDRILYKSPRVKHHYYTRHEVLASDHRPVSAGLSVDLRTMNYLERDRILHRLNFCWRDEQLKSISHSIKVRHVAAFQRCTSEEAERILGCLDWDVDAAVSRVSKDSVII